MKRTEHSKVEVVAEFGPEHARGVEVEGADEEGAVEQDALARLTARFERSPVARPMETSKVACAGGGIVPVVRALEAPAWPLEKAGALTDVGGESEGDRGCMSRAFAEWQMELSLQSRQQRKLFGPRVGGETFFEGTGRRGRRRCGCAPG